MGDKAVFLARDGVINYDYGFVHSVEHFVYTAGAKDALRRLQSLGYRLVVVANQPGIARGLYTEIDFQALTRWMVEDLKAAGICIDGVYHCPHHPSFSGPCDCYEPATGLFAQAVRDLGLDLDLSWSIGVHPRDVAICKQTGCRGVLVGGAPCAGVPTVRNLPEATRLIENALAVQKNYAEHH